ncbi:SIR2 family NAD-dependent protein deacylase [Cystobacter ferrugineus]|uniref:NAD-dependent protein deacylase n=1 Tax=Cystobacter ferrugineus TaxID=83449 RepID=A0A1L9B9J0_9BACT|nr:NAD-dependent deacylase [Cystobacter ferrugineus]OJH38927.1 NAD-dependent deacylase [Cystobacter ferrugineus]
MERLHLDDDTRLLVLTGAGVSAESGIPTFRGADGLWMNHPIEEVATPEGFEENPARVWHFYSRLRAAAVAHHPNPGHLAIAEWERRLGDRFLLATQNIDGLHQVAGSERVVELHGNLFSTRCHRCARAPFEDRTAYPEGRILECEQCQGLLRPDIVWFGEMLAPDHLARVDAFLARTDTRLVFLAVGTSGAVWPAAGFVEEAREVGGRTWLVNADPADNTRQFHHFVQGRSGEVLPALVTFD